MIDQIDKACIIDYWRAVELFSPQNVPRVAPNDADAPTFLGRDDTPLPWEEGHPLRCPGFNPKISRRFTVYCGLFDLEKVKSTLEGQFGKDPESFDGRSDAETCAFAFSVTDDGRPLFDSFVLSTCAWATGRTLSPGPTSADWLVGFETTADQVAAEFSDRFAIHQDDELGQKLKTDGFNLGRPIGYSDILRETKLIAEELGIAALCNSFEIRVKAVFIASSKKYDSDEQDFLNSFFVKDLTKVAAAIRHNHLGKGLSTYLSGCDELDTAKRIDVRKSIDILFQKLSPQLFPVGRWPSKDHHPLVFGQQFAINSQIQALMTNEGLFAVNGPPGTGKTTLLRDLIAAVVVERAKKLAELCKPEEAFSEVKQWKVDGYTRTISIWKEELRGFEIVVASYNNGAVENISLEIPGYDAVDRSWDSQADYFPEFATQLIEQPAWAMIAARLGNKKNRNEFKNKFWFGVKEPEDKNGVKASNKTPNPAADGFLKLLKSYEDQPADWSQAVITFKKALADEQQLRKEREEIFSTYQVFYSIRNQISGLEKQIAEVQSRCDEAVQGLKTLQDGKMPHTLHLEEAKTRRLEHRQFRPGLLEIIMTLGVAFREWRQKDKQFETDMASAERSLTELKNQLLSQNQLVKSLEKEIQQNKNTLSDKRTSLKECSRTLDCARDRFGSFFPLPENWRNEEIAKELSSPWADPEWNKARAKVFLEALQLHKAFVASNAATIRKNLQGAMDIMSGDVPDDAPSEAVAAAWTTLFFVIPVISTTFASFDRLFSHLKQESIGWLLIDEAGQATPQSAVGAIWRSKRTVVVGDPLQLEPVVTIPFTVQGALRKYYEVDEVWTPGTASVQLLADRVSTLGTYLKNDDGHLWVGSPLRVHRRCDQPMFDISNKVAYDGLMVFGTANHSSLDLHASSWVDVCANDSEGHWVPQEGQSVKKLIDYLTQSGVHQRDIFLISPFRAVVNKLTKIYIGTEVKVGTIHTVQGKESTIVILVLGGDPNKPGAKKWASQRPNLLNVAVSRAKRRLFVVGNREQWRKYRYFSDCASNLEVLSI